MKKLFCFCSIFLTLSVAKAQVATIDASRLMGLDTMSNIATTELYPIPCPEGKFGCTVAHFGTRKRKLSTVVPIGAYPHAQIYEREPSVILTQKEYNALLKRIKKLEDKVRP